MTVIDHFNRLVQPLANRIRNLLVYTVVGAVDDTGDWQRMDMEALASELRGGVAVFDQYGFACNMPVPDAANPEALVLRVGGRVDAAFIIASRDRRYRLKNLASSEVALYSAQGQTILLKANGEIVLTAAMGAKIRLESDTTIDADLVVTGDIHGQGTVKGDTDVVVGSSPASVSLKGHVHLGTNPSSTPPGALVDSSTMVPINGSTAPPTPT